MQVSSGFLELPEWELGEGPGQELGGAWNSAGSAQPWAQPSPGFVPSSYSPAPLHPPHPTQCLSLGYTTFAPTQGVRVGVNDCDCASTSGPRQCWAPHLLSFRSGLKASLGRGTESSVPPQLLGHSP